MPRSRRHRNLKRRGGQQQQPPLTETLLPPTTSASSCAAPAHATVASTCSPPVDVSMYKNPCVNGALPLDNAFLSNPTKMRGGRRHRKRSLSAKIKHRRVSGRNRLRSARRDATSPHSTRRGRD